MRTKLHVGQINAEELIQKIIDQRLSKLDLFGLIKDEMKPEILHRYIKLVSFIISLRQG